MKTKALSQGKAGVIAVATMLACVIAFGLSLAPSTALAELKTGSTAAPSFTLIDQYSLGKVTLGIKGTGASSYEYQIALSKSFKKGKKTIKTKATKATFKKLKNGTKYFIRVRAKGGSWTKTMEATTPIKQSATKFAGTWRMYQSTDSAENRAIKNIPKSKRTKIKMTNNGTFKLIGSKTLKYKWSAFPNNYAVMHSGKGYSICVLSLSKGKLSFMMPSTSDYTKIGKIWRFERV